MKNSPATAGEFCSSLQALRLPLHVLDHHIIDVAKRGAVLEHTPGDVSVEVQLHEVVATGYQQAFSVDVVLYVCLLYTSRCV